MTLRRTQYGVGSLKVIALALLFLIAGGCAAPEAIVVDASNAAAAGDRDAYLACFTPRSRAFLKVLWATTAETRPELSALGSDGIALMKVRVLRPSPDGTERAAIEIREGEERRAIVVHQAAGAWRIDLPDTERETAMAGLRHRFPTP